MNTNPLTKINIQLPPGCSERPGKLEDYLLLFDLVNSYSLHINGHPDLNDPELIKQDWLNPGFNPETDVRVILGPQGAAIGLVECWLNHHPPVHPWVWICVHPDYLDKGVWEYLLTWGKTHAQAALEIVPSDLRVAPRTGTEHTNLLGVQAIKSLGWEHVRSFYRMTVDLDTAPEVPPLPEGITIRTFDSSLTAETIYLAVDEAFKDHYGYVVQPYEQGFAQFKHNMIDSPGFDPNFWFLAMDGDEIAGLSLCRLADYEDPQSGWVNELAVRRPWRKRGLASTLLKHSFAAFYAQGQKRAGLGVDASNLTGALRVYQRAGMRVERQFDNFEIELRPGRELSTEELE